MSLVVTIVGGDVVVAFGNLLEELAQVVVFIQVLASVTIAHHHKEAVVVLHSCCYVLIYPHIALFVINFLGVAGSRVNSIDVHASLGAVEFYHHESGIGLLAKLDVRNIVFLDEWQFNLCEFA